MRNNNRLFRKILVCGIVLLFIGLSVTSIISGYQSMNDDDYVNGYWEFDEGNGNTAHDSSGHDYDGTIYGATWTTGHSGYALDYDGVDDYVSLDAYSENLGFNKTDDMIFSVYFKTTSTDPGCIYSISHNWVGQYPEVHIGLNSDGNIKIQIWVGSCGHTTISEDTYNDGEWHYLKIIYHGTTANPTVDLYVDNDLDISITEWVCAFSADEFKKARIGSQSRDAIEYFDGTIDKLKIIKYGGGNHQPSRPNIDGPQFGLNGEELSYTFVATDPEEDDVYYKIDWGDGEITNWIGPSESGEEITRSHSWSENGSYEITAKAKDFWHEGWWTDPPFLISIGNHAPWPPEQPSGPTLGSIDIEYTFSTSTIDEEGDEIWYRWDWGDGTFIELGPYASGDTCYASHTWTSPDTYDVRVKAKDGLGESLWSDPPLQVSIVISAIEISKITGGLLKVNAVIKNTGEWEATDVSWHIDLVGGLIFIGSNSSGEISSIPVDGETTISSSGIIFGFGQTVVTVTAQAPDGSHDTYKRNALVLLFFVKINPGGAI